MGKELGLRDPLQGTRGASDSRLLHCKTLKLLRNQMTKELKDQSLKNVELIDAPPITCKCSGKIIMGYVDGHPCLGHTEPPCREFSALDLDKLLETDGALTKALLDMKALPN